MMIFPEIIIWMIRTHMSSYGRSKEYIFRDVSDSEIYFFYYLLHGGYLPSVQFRLPENQRYATKEQSMPPNNIL